MSGLEYRSANIFASRATSERTHHNNDNDLHLNPIPVQA